MGLSQHICENLMLWSNKKAFRIAPEGSSIFVVISCLCHRYAFIQIHILNGLQQLGTFRHRALEGFTA